MIIIDNSTLILGPHNTTKSMTFYNYELSVLLKCCNIDSFRKVKKI